VAFKRSGCFAATFSCGSSHSNNLLRVCAYDDPRTTRGEDILPGSPQGAQPISEILLDPRGVECVFRLINQHGRIPIGQEYHQDRSAALTVRQVVNGDILPVIGFAEPHRKYDWSI
jgi:hypothetical protein